MTQKQINDPSDHKVTFEGSSDTNFMLGDVFLVHHFFPIPAFQWREDISKRKKLSQVHTYTYCTVVETHRFAFHDLWESSYLWERPGESMIGIFLLRGPRPQLQATEEGRKD